MFLADHQRSEASDPDLRSTSRSKRDLFVEIRDDNASARNRAPFAHAHTFVSIEKETVPRTMSRTDSKRDADTSAGAYTPDLVLLDDPDARYVQIAKDERVVALEGKVKDLDRNNTDAYLRNKRRMGPSPPDCAYTALQLKDTLHTKH